MVAPLPSPAWSSGCIRLTHAELMLCWNWMSKRSWAGWISAALLSCPALSQGRLTGRTAGLRDRLGPAAGPRPVLAVTDLPTLAAELRLSPGSSCKPAPCSINWVAGLPVGARTLQGTLGFCSVGCEAHMLQLTAVSSKHAQVGFCMLSAGTLDQANMLHDAACLLDVRPCAVAVLCP